MFIFLRILIFQHLIYYANFAYYFLRKYCLRNFAYLQIFAYFIFWVFESVFYFFERHLELVKLAYTYVYVFSYFYVFRLLFFAYFNILKVFTCICCILQFFYENLSISYILILRNLAYFSNF